MKLQDYLHLYIGCEGEFTPPDGIAYYRPEKLTPDILGRVLYDGYAFKPLLRPLSDMTEEEEEEWLSLREEARKAFQGKFADSDWATHRGFCEGSGTLYLLSRPRYFDLFGLIDAGLALDKTKQPIK